MGQEVKNPLRAQSKYGLMASSAKTGKKFFRGSPEHFLDKSAIWDRIPPTYTSIAVYMCGGGFKGPKSSNGIQIHKLRAAMLLSVPGVEIHLHNSHSILLPVLYQRRRTEQALQSMTGRGHCILTSMVTVRSTQRAS